MAQCAECGTERVKPELPRLPRGWKRKGEAIHCSACWRKHYILRAITLRIAAPVAEGTETAKQAWKRLNDALKPMWVETTACSNWMITELYARDVRRHGEEKMPPMPRVYLYPEARKRFPNLPAQTVASLEQAIQAKYRARRYEIIWLCSGSLANYRYPVPFPVHNQSWSIASEGEWRVVSARVGEGRVRLRLKQGFGFHRQMRALDQMISAVAVRGEMALYQQGTGLMCKMVAWLPRPERSENLSGVLRVHTEKDRLLIAVNAKDERLWNYNGDHLRRWTAEHHVQLQRWSEDSKAENRPVPSFAERRSQAAGKYRRRLNSACHEIAAQLAGYARRRRFSEVVYDDSETQFVPAFPYFQLRRVIAEKLDSAGIKFTASAPAKAESQEPLAGEVS